MHAKSERLEYLTAFEFTEVAYSALTLLVGRQEGHPSGHKKTEWWGTGMVMCLGRGADLHKAQLMPLPFTVSCSSKSRVVLPFWFWYTQTVRKRAVKQVFVFLNVIEIDRPSDSEQDELLTSVESLKSSTSLYVHSLKSLQPGSTSEQPLHFV